jgi:hypothetical protein
LKQVGKRTAEEQLISMSTPVELPQMETPETQIPAPESSPLRTAARRQAGTEVPKLGRATQGGSISWVTSIFMVIFHILAITALFFFTWKGAIALVVLYVLSINVGIGMCYHRLLTHRGYKVPRWLEHTLAVAYAQRRYILGAYGLDYERTEPACRNCDDEPLRSRSRQGSVLCLALEVSLGITRSCRAGTAGLGRLASGFVGYFPAGHAWTACDLAGELGYAPVGFAAL